MTEENPTQASSTEEGVAFLEQKMRESGEVLSDLLAKLASLDPAWLGDGAERYQEAVERLLDED